VPTHREDRPLRRCLDSVKAQLKGGDEVIVVGDTFDGPMPAVAALVKEFGAPYRYVELNAGGHSYGHEELNYGISLAKGDYVAVNDDDDIWTPDALATFRKLAGAVSQPQPFLFRFRSHAGMIFWHQPGLFARNWIGGHCLLAPNVKGKLGKFTPEYSGDFSYVEGTVNYYGGPEHAIWRPEIIAVARPI
jgi:glycosyltransferase involved in cell wall biosynthesis